MVLNGILGLFNLGTGEIIIIAIVILLLFGGKNVSARKIPQRIRSVGNAVGLRIYVIRHFLAVL